MQETQVQSLSWEDPLVEGMATHSSILARRIPMNSGVWGAIIHRVAKELDTTKVTKHTWSELSYSLFIAPSNIKQLCNSERTIDYFEFFYFNLPL